LFLNIIGALSQWERTAIGERTRAALAHLRATGRRVSRFAPYGYRLAPGALGLGADPTLDQLAPFTENTNLAFLLVDVDAKMLHGWPLLSAALTA